MQPKDKVTFNSKGVGPGSSRSVIQLSHGKQYTVGEVDYANRSLRIVEDPTGNWHSMNMFNPEEAYSPLVIGEEVVFDDTRIPTGISGCILPTVYAEMGCVHGHVYIVDAIAPGGGIRLRGHIRYYNPEQFVRKTIVARTVTVKPVKDPEVLGWNVKPEFKSTAQKLKFFRTEDGIDIPINSDEHQFFNKMGVLDIWFTPVHFSPSMVQKYTTQHGSVIRIGVKIRFGMTEVNPKELEELMIALTPRSFPAKVSGLTVSDPVLIVSIGGHKLHFSELAQIVHLYKEYRARL